MNSIKGEIMEETSVRLSKIKGTTMQPGRQDNVKSLIQGQTIYAVPEPTNPVDPNAVKLYADEAHTKDLGYIDADMLRSMSDYYVEAVMVRSVGCATISKGRENWGANISIIFKKKVN